jgi:hypothetical protein
MGYCGRYDGTEAGKSPAVQPLRPTASLSQCAYVCTQSVGVLRFSLRVWASLSLTAATSWVIHESVAVGINHHRGRDGGRVFGEQPDEGHQGHDEGAWARALKAANTPRPATWSCWPLLFDILAKSPQRRADGHRKRCGRARTNPRLFKKYPTVGHDHHVVEFMTDYLRMMVSGNLNAHEIESLMDSEIETHHHEEHAASMLPFSVWRVGCLRSVLWLRCWGW